MSNEPLKPIEIEVTLDYEDFRRILFLMSWQRLRFFWIILPFAAVFLAIAIFSSGTITSPLAYFAPIFPLIIMGVLAYNVIASAKKKAQQSQQVTYIFTDDFVQVKSSEVDEIIEWKNFVSFLETKSDFLLIRDDSQIYQMPKRCFPSDKLSVFADILPRKISAA